MTETLLKPSKESLWPQIGLSIFLHVVIIVVAILRVVVFSKPVVYTDAIRVDIVGMPEMIHQPKPIPQKAPAPKPLPKPLTPPKVKIHVKSNAPKVNLSQKQSEQDAINRIKALEQIEKSVQKPKPQPKQKYYGNVLSPGTTLTGIDKIEHDAYIQQMDKIVKKNWILPEWLSHSDLHAQVLVKINASGTVVSRTIVTSSGNSVFDAQVLQAIDKSSPFPTPPSKFVQILEVSGVEFGFPQ